MAGGGEAEVVEESVLEWLLDSDPGLRWQVLADVVHAPADVVAAERSRVGAEGWGAQLLALQGADGQWDGGAYLPGSPRPVDLTGPDQPWTATAWSLQLLRLLGRTGEPAGPSRGRGGARAQPVGTRR